MVGFLVFFSLFLPMSFFSLGYTQSWPGRIEPKCASSARHPQLWCTRRVFGKELKIPIQVFIQAIQAIAIQLVIQGFEAI